VIFHIMKDGTRRESIDGYVVKYEQKKELYKKIFKEKTHHGGKNTSRAFCKKQILDR
jgi:hypothetical protein